MRVSLMRSISVAAAESEFCEHLGRVLAEQRRRPLEAQRRVREAHRADHLWDAAGERVRQVAQHLAVPDLRVVEHPRDRVDRPAGRSEEHTSELQSLMRISYAVFCLKKKKRKHGHK